MVGRPYVTVAHNRGFYRVDFDRFGPVAAYRLSQYQFAHYRAADGSTRYAMRPIDDGKDLQPSLVWRVNGKRSAIGPIVKAVLAKAIDLRLRQRSAPIDHFPPVRRRKGRTVPLGLPSRPDLFSEASDHDRDRS